MTLSELLEKLKEKSDKAHREICDLASGKRRWEMSIPVRETDSDMVLQAPLDLITTLIEIVKEQDEALYRIAGTYDDFGSHVISEKARARTLEKLKGLVG